jgi:arsenate reductase
MLRKDALFICVHNSARSQRAEEYIRLLSGGSLTVESAGFEPTEINPLVVEAMQEEGLDLSGKKTQSVFELFKTGRTFRFVVTVCDESEGGQCPIFPGMTHRLHLPFPDPSKLTGTHEEKLAKVREIRDEIKKLMRDFVEWERTDTKRQLGRVWERVDIQGASPE